jgi:hypothetical protein
MPLKLFDPFEEDFHSPPITIKFCDNYGWQGKSSKENISHPDEIEKKKNHPG